MGAVFHRSDSHKTQTELGKAKNFIYLWVFPFCYRVILINCKNLFLWPDTIEFKCILFYHFSPSPFENTFKKKTINI